MTKFLPFALAAYTWARKHPKVVLTAASVVLLRGVALVWTDVPSEAILDALRVALVA